MKVKTTKLWVATYLAPDIALIEETLPDFRKTVDECRSNGPVNIVIDLQRVNFIDSSCLEYIQDLSTQLRLDGSTLRLAAPTEVCKEILVITRTDLAVSTFDDLESAGRSFI